MATSRATTHDPQLPLPEPLDPLPPLGGPGGGSVLEGVATEAPLLLAGRRAWALGSERHGIREVRLESAPSLLNFRVDAGAGRRVAVAPGSLRREIEGPAGALAELVLVFPELPAAALQWVRPPLGEVPLELEIRFELGPFASTPEHPTRFRAHGAVLRIAPGDGDTDLLSFLQPAPEAWEIEEETGPDGTRLQVRVSVRCAEGGPITLGVAAEPRTAREGDTSLSPFRFLLAQERRWASTGRGNRDEPLVVDASEPEVGMGIDWAKARVDGGGPGGGPADYGTALPVGAPGREVGTGQGPGPTGPEHPAEDALWMGMGALAAGRFSLATAILETALEARPWEGEGDGSRVAPLTLLLTGESVRWSGSLEILRSRREELLRAARWCRDQGRRPASTDSGSLSAAGLRALADAQEIIGGRSQAGELRRWAREAASAPGSPGLLDALVGDMRLPPDWPSRLPEGGATARAALLGWALFRQGHAREGWLLWRELLRRGMEPPRGMWPLDTHPEATVIPNYPPAAALLLAGFVFGLLGARGDAWFGRLRLRPQIPPHWSSLRISNLLLGDSRVALDYTRRGEEHVFRIQQTGGRVPLNLVFEPLLAQPHPTVLLNGTSLEVGSFELGERAGVRFQLPLHQEQVVVLRPGEG